MKTSFKNHSEVAHIWAQQSQESGNAGNIFFNGKSIYSYGHHFEIARFIIEDIVFFTTRTYSNTTAKHKSIVLSAISHKNVFVVPSFEDHIENVHHYIKEINETLLKSARAKTYGEWLFNEAKEYSITLKNYIDIFKPELSKEDQKAVEKVLSDELYSDEKRQEILEKAKKISVKKAIETTKRNKENQIKEVIELDQWRERIIQNSYHTFKYLTGPFLRIGNDNKTIETSRGAYVSEELGKRLYKMYKVGIPIHGEKIENYTVISTDSEHIKIGCHNISVNEIELLAIKRNW